MPQDEYVNRLYGSQARGNAPANGHANGSAPQRAGRNGTLPKDYPAVYDHSKKVFWDRNALGEWVSYGESQFQRKLSLIGVAKDASDVDGLNGMQFAMASIIEQKSVHFAGELAGYPVGSYDIMGNRVLITRGPKVPKPANIPFPQIEKFLNSLLGEERKYFDAWLKSALNSLKAGNPFRPGQILGLAGPANCGKSLLQDLITEALGGRSAKPWRYLAGESNFNSDLFRAEHLYIEDEPASVDSRTRRHFAAAIKGLCVNRVQSFHPKGREPMSLTPFWRLTISVNDDQHHLMVLPQLDDSLVDKLILLKASQAKFPFDSEDLDGRKAFRQRLTDQMPGYLYWLRNWRLPQGLRDQRFGCAAYQNEELATKLRDLEPEHKLWTLIQALGVIPEGHVGWTGEAGKLDILLREKDRSGEVSRVNYYNTACGVYLERLSRIYPQNVRKVEGTKGRPRWQITVPDDNEF